jgi:hypothetical protein
MTWNVQTFGRDASQNVRVVCRLRSRITWGRIHQIFRPDWFVLATVWAASIAMNEPVGGAGIGALDLALAVNRGLLGLFICFVLVPSVLERGRYLFFATSSVLIFAAAGALHLYGVGPWLAARGVAQLGCYQCFITQSLPTVATMAVVKLSWSLLEQQKSAAIASQEHSETELRFLRTQMSPHLLFNSLNNVYSYALEQSDRAPEMILKLSAVLRYMLYEAGDDVVPLSLELDYINDYFALQQLATEGRGDVHLSITGDPAECSIAPLILIVFIENCFKHAVETTEQVRVAVSIEVKDKVLLLNTVNNLPSDRSSHAGKRPGGIGLENVQRRLELLYPGRHRLQVGEEGGAFVATLMLALEAE